MATCRVFFSSAREVVSSRLLAPSVRVRRRLEDNITAHLREKNYMFADKLLKRSAASLAAISLIAIGQPSASRADAITPEEAHAIGVTAYVYFYPLITMDVTRQQLHKHRGRKIRDRRPDEHVYPTFVPDSRHEGCRAAQLRHALFQRLAGSDERTYDRLGPQYRRALLSPADARYVDQRICLARLAHHRNSAATSSSCHPAGPDRFRQTSRVSTRRRLTSGLSGARRQMVRRIMMRSTKFRRDIKSPRFPNGVGRQSRSKQRLTRQSI